MGGRPADHAARGGTQTLFLSTNKANKVSLTSTSLPYAYVASSKYGASRLKYGSTGLRGKVLLPETAWYADEVK
jgi:hypothetical protein